MTVRKQLSEELEQSPDSVIEEVLDFCLLLKQDPQEQTTQVDPPQKSGILDLLEQIEEIQAQTPTAEWDKLPHDGSINHDHYLYGTPKVEK